MVKRAHVWLQASRLAARDLREVLLTGGAREPLALTNVCEEVTGTFTVAFALK